MQYGLKQLLLIRRNENHTKLVAPGHLPSAVSAYSGEIGVGRKAPVTTAIC